MSPVLPSDFQECIPAGSDTLCQSFVKVFIKLPVLWWRFYKYRYKSDGTFTEEYAAELCANVCPPDTETTT